MGHRLLAAAALMMLTTASAWAENEGVPTVKTPDPDRVEAQMEDTIDDIKSYSVEQKNQAMQTARHALDDLDQQITYLQSDIDSKWQDLSQQTRLKKQKALAALKDQQQALEQRYQALQDAGADNWEAAKVQFEQSWQAAKRGWEKLTAPASADDNPS
ncbi:hypothetical protein A11A3_08950 [Alcanivorax hongdengensis A-11-3]|uniref:Chromosome segregation ATPase n=1 Tax=Alcanivorax hongdengensis A-11-3 TaxID=1177179 RepID=L0WET3_9GAMM|nr:hypothetical protein [Alcanivorax hongdengensis]EKF74315.1 hypothetical protein A11A3_08950 [Alcanivorax hongdengensis A-11-3]